MKQILIAFALGCIAAMPNAYADGTARILKVLPHFLDAQGRNSLSPSLFERDAYQAFLRKNPDKQAGLRFDVHWKANRSQLPQALLRVEIRSAKEFFTKPLVLEQSVKPRSKIFGTWSSVTVAGEPFAKMGEMFAWRVTLWSGEKLIAEQKSFLW